MKIKYDSEFKLSLDRTTRVQQFNDWLLSQIRLGHRNLNVVINESRTYSNVCVPIAGTIQYYRANGIKIQVDARHSDYARHTRLWNPFLIEQCDESEKHYPFDKVWTFSTSEGVNNLVSAYILALRQSDIIESGVIESIEWCLNEVMDNVLQHSKSKNGFVMAQIHKQSKLFAFCVFDAGIGFYNSLKDSKHHPEKPIDAITLALQEKITRDENVGQGNGLWGLSSIVAKSNGQIDISSSGAVYSLRNGRMETKKEGGFILSKEHGSSCLDVQINYGTAIDIVGALTTSSGKKYEPVDIWLDNLEDDQDRYVISVSEQSGGTGTRQSAQKLRTLALNISNIKKKIVVFDFNGVNLISSSFADELIGKIVADKGFFYFNKAFRIENMSVFNANILNRSVGQRMAQVYFDEAVQQEY